jgi:phosphatidate cytidylyltransferase
VNNLLTRSLTGLVFTALIIIAVLISRITFTALFFVINIFTLIEFFRLVNNKRKMTGILWVGVFGGAIVYTLISLVSVGLVNKTWLLINFMVPVFIAVFYLYKKNGDPVFAISTIISGITYITVPFAILGFLYEPTFTTGETHPGVLLGFFIIVWSYDSFAYLTGVLLGRHKLFERHSPGKTWEGTIGGGVFALVASWVLFSVYGIFNLSTWLIMGVLIIVFGTLGDLTESMLKRNLHVKDSGKTLPGHGGLLDRFDAVLITSPVIFVFLAFVA